MEESISANRSHPPTKSAAHEPSISIVIPCFDAETTLATQLTALSRQEWSGPWEVIVADNGSTDGSGTIVEAFRDRLPGLRLVDASERPGPAHARNRGAGASTSDILLFCDADDEVGDGWVAAMARAVSEHGFVASRFEVERLNAPWVAASHRHPQETGLNPYTYPPFLPHAGGAGLGIRRPTHESLGGFDEDLPALEDTDYCWRAQLDGQPLVFAGDAVVHVRFKDELGENFRQLFTYGLYNVAIYRRYRDRGMPRLPVISGLTRWLMLGVRLPRVLSRRGRTEWIGQLGWRLGRLVGCVRFRTLAL